MKEKLKRSVIGPAIIFGIVIALVVALTVLWNFVLAHDYARIRDLAREAEEVGGAFHWTFIALGSAFFLTILILLIYLGIKLFAEIRFSERQSRFIASVTHELNSPLSSIKLFAQTLRKPDLSADERARFLDLVLADVERLRSLIANVLRQAQIDGARLTLAKERVALGELVEMYAQGLSAALAKQGGGDRALAVRIEADAEVEIDRAIFRQALDNLVDNAFKFSKEDRARVEIAVVEAGRPDRIAIDVRDEGIGIEKRDLREIFTRFRRSGTKDPSRARPGTGLGLSIVRAIVEAHGGTVEAHSPGPGGGATFRIELPRAKRAAEGAGTSASEAEGDGAGARAGGAETAGAAPAAASLPPAPAPAGGGGGALGEVRA